MKITISRTESIINWCQSDENETKEILSLYRNSLKPKLQNKFKLNNINKQKKLNNGTTTTLLSQQNVWAL